MPNPNPNYLVSFTDYYVYVECTSIQEALQSGKSAAASHSAFKASSFDALRAVKSAFETLVSHPELDGARPSDDDVVDTLGEVLAQSDQIHSYKIICDVSTNPPKIVEQGATAAMVVFQEEAGGQVFRLRILATRDILAGL